MNQFNSYNESHQGDMPYSWVAEAQNSQQPEVIQGHSRSHSPWTPVLSRNPERLKVQLFEAKYWVKRWKKTKSAWYYFHKIRYMLPGSHCWGYYPGTLLRSEHPEDFFPEILYNHGIFQLSLTHIGQVTELCLSCYLVLLSIDSKTR